MPAIRAAGDRELRGQSLTPEKTVAAVVQLLETTLARVGNDRYASENATYGLTICAERVAMFKALSEGHRRFSHLVVAADTRAPTPPCGACRQILWEFGGNHEVILVNLRREHRRYQLAELLPVPFDDATLRGK